MAKVQFSLRLPQELLDAIDAAAAKQVRDRSNMIEFILTEWIAEHENTEAETKPARKSEKKK